MVIRSSLEGQSHQAIVLSPSANSPVWRWELAGPAVGVAALFLALGLWLGINTASRGPTPSGTVALFDEQAARDVLTLLNEQNAALEQALADRRAAQAKDGGESTSSSSQSEPNFQSVPPAQTIPPPSGSQPFQGTLSDLLRQATVFVLAKKTSNLSSTGSGFFISPELVVTNHHVIADASEVWITNEKLEELTSAEIVAKTASGQGIWKPDFAILRVSRAPSVQPLTLTTNADIFQWVAAIGYPAILTEEDPAYRRLVAGDRTAVPLPDQLLGPISKVADSPGGSQIITFGAQISPGNSGGPLVDSCGRVVGVNTWVKVDQTLVTHINFALKTDELINFLRENDISANVQQGQCPPPPSADGQSSATPTVQ